SRLRKGYRVLRNDYGEITSVLQEVISGVRLVKSFRGEPSEDSLFMRASAVFATGARRINRLSFVSQPLTEIIGTSIALLILWIGAQDVLREGGQRMTGPELIGFMTLVTR